MEGRGGRTGRGPYGADPRTARTEQRAPQPSAGLIGTALPTSAEEEDPRTTGPVWRQVATDAEGRRRFHGAFTGGFSAGYFNTVGSKEGWTPSTFVSSRSQRSGVQQRPEDFMDDEDYADITTGGRAVKMKEAFDSFNPHSRPDAKIQSTAPPVGGGSIPGFLPIDLIAPANSPIGIKLLRLMGWREGQGIGPRKERRKKREPVIIQGNETSSTPKKKVYGLAIPLDELRAQDSDKDLQAEADESFEDIQHFSVPPSDTETIVFDAKTNFFGLGYDPYVMAPELRGKARSFSGNVTPSGLGRQTIGALLSGRSQGHAGFGLGAFEDADDHEHHMFSSENMEEYDHELQDSASERGQSLPHAADVRSVNEREAMRTFRKSHGLAPAKWFPPPEVPKDYHPFHYFTSTLYSDAMPIMNADKRGEILGETPLPSPHMPRKEHAGSVFDLISPEDKQRLSALQTRFEKSVSETEAMGEGATYHRFANEPAKQMRFRNFLLLQSGQPAPPLPARYDNLTEWEREKEREEFIRLANDFKKVPDVMASRFQSAGQLDLSGKQTSEATQSHEASGKSQEAIAASMKLFGKLTRSEEDWLPEGLLCKRFNLRQPHPDAKRPLKQGTTPLMSGVETMFSPTALARPSLQLGPKVATELEQPGPEAEKETEELSESLADRPPVDIFKAIFEPEDESDSEEHSGDEEAEDVKEPPSSALEATQPSKEPIPREEHRADVMTHKSALSESVIKEHERKRHRQEEKEANSKKRHKKERRDRSRDRERKTKKDKRRSGDRSSAAARDADREDYDTRKSKRY